VAAEAADDLLIGHRSSSKFKRRHAAPIGWFLPVPPQAHREAFSERLDLPAGTSHLDSFDATWRERTIRTGT